MVPVPVDGPVACVRAASSLAGASTGSNASHVGSIGPGAGDAEVVVGSTEVAAEEDLALPDPQAASAMNVANVDNETAIDRRLRPRAYNCLRH